MPLHIGLFSQIQLASLLAEPFSRRSSWYPQARFLFPPSPFQVTSPFFITDLSVTLIVFCLENLAILKKIKTNMFAGYSMALLLLSLFLDSLKSNKKKLKLFFILLKNVCSFLKFARKQWVLG